MKRLVICCDGTWNRPDSPHITNIEKIARTVQTDSASAGGVTQLVYYLAGVGGAGYESDRVLGGAFGFGLFNTMMAGYRFLAQNYEPGDEVFVLGFSRGAFTARSLVGMVGYVGLITKLALVEDRLPQARAFYQARKEGDRVRPETLEEFRAKHCHAVTPVAFVGVFDTVGALGVPGAMAFAPRFHDLHLGAEVGCARQALAIDELRLKFEPSLWTAPPGTTTEDPRVKQVWFEGAHSDVGGGYGETGLSDSALLWMAGEAHARGLTFDAPLLAHYIASGARALRHNPLKPLFRFDNVLLKAKRVLLRGDSASFIGDLRRIGVAGRLSQRVASTAAADLMGTDYHPANLQVYAAETNDFAAIVEPVTRLPQASRAATLALIAPLGEPPKRIGTYQ